MSTDRSRLSNLAWSLGPLLGLVVVSLIFGAIEYQVATDEGREPQFFTPQSVQVVLNHASLIGVAALGMTLIIIAGGIDLSAGTAIALTATVIAWIYREGFEGMADWRDTSPVLATLVLSTLAIIGGVLTGCLCGFVNGGLISLLRLVPFIVTLGTMTAFQGIGRTISGETPVRAYGKVPDAVASLQKPYPDPEWMLVSPSVWIMLILAAIVALALRYTVFGRHVFAIGSNESTARLCGINVVRTRILVYTLAGVFVGVAGLYQFTVLGGEGDPVSGLGLELKVIAAVVIGGGSLNGGRGSILGTLSGACIITVIQHGCVLIGVPDHYQDILIGLIIIAAVTIDQLRTRIGTH
ncbi:MAG TPA: ABC transporter permease [Planctomycetaceae bacterium]|nr:ABC transporter permease [Planctomycetaceae bacterium]